MRKKITMAVLFTAFAFSVAFPQSGTRSIDYNTRSFGRGGTGIGFFDSPALIMSNPAGLSFLKNSAVNANAIFMVPGTHFKNYKKDANGNVTTNVLNDNDGESTLFIMPSLAYVQKIKDSKFTFGAGVFTTGGMGTDYELSHELFPDKQIYRSRFATIESCISGSYLITPEFSVGVTGEFVYSTLEIAQPFTLPPSVLTGTLMTSQGSMTFGQYFSGPRPQGLGYSELTAAAEMTGLASYTFGGKIGLAYKFSDKFSMGASYTLSVPLKYKDGDATMDMNTQFQQASGIAVQNLVQVYGISVDSAAKLVNALFTANGINSSQGFNATYKVDNEFSLPQSAGFGFMYAPITKFRFGFDFEWLNWSKAFDEMNLTLKDGSSSNINTVIGNGSSESDPLIVNFPMDWKDAIILKFGGEYDISDVFTVRGGYAYSTNPIPNTTIIPIMPAVLEHHFTAGFSYDILKQLTMNFALEYGLEKTLTGSNPHKVASEYINSESSLQNMLSHISFQYNF
ncbi:MAG: outer membrane protein transport protein [Ignavibacteria bacterium]|jgi:long-chain fatty acid transport protein|nr:outer membrane protein transport protein [Ignavibacteria bacterium]